MKRSILLYFFLLLIGLYQASGAEVMIEAEAFQFKGRWVVERSSECLGSAMLRVFQNGDEDEAGADAFTVFQVPEAGQYNVWVRSRDYVGSTRPRSFTLSIDGTPMSVAGVHGKDAFYWEKVGTAKLDKKKVLLRLTDTGRYYGRCDAILFTTDNSLDPNTKSNTEIARYRRNPVTMEYGSGANSAFAAPQNIGSGYSTIATISNGEIRLSFVRLAEGGRIVAKTDYYADGSWRRFGGSAEDNRIGIISSAAAPATDYDNFYPSWSGTSGRHTFSFEGKDYAVTVDGDRGNPFYAGTLTEARALTVSKTDDYTIKVSYECGGLGTLTGYWSIPQEGTHIGLRLTFSPAAEGNYSFAVHGLKDVETKRVRSTLMPPVFVDAALPTSPLMMTSSMMTQCLAAVETTDGATAYVAADLADFSRDWGTPESAVIGFTLMDSRGEAEPVAFAPVPGAADTRVRANRLLERRFVLGVHPGTWQNALEYVSDNVFKVSDYRRADGSSLAQSIHNIISLLKDDEHSGWNARMKGFWDIECNGNTDPTVVQSAPLALVGAAALCDDEELYRRRALPAIEFALSRLAYRFRGLDTIAFDPKTSQFPTTLYEGINTLSGGLNPWLAELAMPEGQVRYRNGYFSTLQAFRQELSAYRLTGDKARLAKAEALADAYVATPSSAPTYGSFYNSQLIADWSPLLDMYRTTGKEQYLTAALNGAAATIAGVKTWPAVAAGTQTVHPGNSYEGVTTVWWRGTEQFRLGFPRRAGDATEHSVEAWKVSSVGLGIEQPGTYFGRTGGKTVRPVYMSNWAPRLSELGILGGKEIFDTYGRNAVLGRAQNYPGYYATGYTDIISAADFPYKGPDVSSIYYHHIPAYLGMMQDFLISRIVALSDGAVSFEPARQEGFVWFANNIYGAQTGTIEGCPARLWMPADGLTTDNVAVSVLAARAKDKVYLLFLNDDDSDADVRCTLGATISAATGTEVVKAKVPGRGIKIESLSAPGVDYAALSEPLTDGMKVVATNTEAGDVYLYRIRSPFGYDTVYGFAACGKIEGLSIEAECGGEIVEADTWPYEWSFGNFGTDEAVDVRIRIKRGSKDVKTVDTGFDAPSSSLANVRVDVPADDAIYTIDGRRVERITAPGLYIRGGCKFVVR